MGYAELKEPRRQPQQKFNELSAEIKDLETQMTANGELQKQIVNYAKTRAVYGDYRKAGYSRKFKEAHEADILIHQAAKKYFDELGIKKLPSVKSLREEYAGLLAQKRTAYAAYKQAREDMKELYNVKSNVEHLLGNRRAGPDPRPGKSAAVAFLRLRYSAFFERAAATEGDDLRVWGMSPTSILRGQASGPPR